MIRYELKRSSSTKPTSVILYYKCFDGVLKYYTGESVLPAKYKESSFNYITSFVEQLQSDYNITNKKLLKSTLKTRLDKHLRKVSDDLDYDGIIAKMEAGNILTPDNKVYSPGTIKSFKNCIKVVRAAGSISDHDLNNKIVLYCNSKGYSLNYTGTVIKRLKTIMRHSGIESKEFKILREDTVDIALEKYEIDTLYNKKLSDGDALVRDWFIIGCFVGTRISDLLRLGAINIAGDNITISNEKTDEIIIVPIHKYVRQILKNRKGFPRKISDQTFNLRIKQIAKACKIKETVLYTYTKAGKREDIYFEKWQMISSHTCRRTFITRLIELCIPDSVIMMLAGIKDPKTLKKYNKLKPEAAAKVLAARWNE
ncbi:MAG: tyrosine-type recombinase/integrase [Agriterribacter sp.]